jgi:hypothetical protein
MYSRGFHFFTFCNFMGFKLRMMDVDGCLYFVIFVFLYFFVVERCLDSKNRKNVKFYKYDNIRSCGGTVV